MPKRRSNQKSQKRKDKEMSELSISRVSDTRTEEQNIRDSARQSTQSASFQQKEGFQNSIEVAIHHKEEEATNDSTIRLPADPMVTTLKHIDIRNRSEPLLPYVPPVFLFDPEADFVSIFDYRHNYRHQWVSTKALIVRQLAINPTIKMFVFLPKWSNTQTYYTYHPELYQQRTKDISDNLWKRARWVEQRWKVYHQNRKERREQLIKEQLEIEDIKKTFWKEFQEIYSLQSLWNNITQHQYYCELFKNRLMSARLQAFTAAVEQGEITYQTFLPDIEKVFLIFEYSFPDLDRVESLHVRHLLKHIYRTYTKFKSQLQTNIKEKCAKMDRARMNQVRKWKNLEYRDWEQKIQKNDVTSTMIDMMCHLPPKYLIEFYQKYMPVRPIPLDLIIKDQLYLTDCRRSQLEEIKIFLNRFADHKKRYRRSYDTQQQVFHYKKKQQQEIKSRFIGKVKKMPSFKYLNMDKWKKLKDYGMQKIKTKVIIDDIYLELGSSKKYGSLFREMDPLLVRKFIKLTLKKDTKQKTQEPKLIPIVKKNKKVPRKIQGPRPQVPKKCPNLSPAALKGSFVKSLISNPKPEQSDPDFSDELTL